MTWVVCARYAGFLVYSRGTEHGEVTVEPSEAHRFRSKRKAEKDRASWDRSWRARVISAAKLPKKASRRVRRRFLQVGSSPPIASLVRGDNVSRPGRAPRGVDLTVACATADVHLAGRFREYHARNRGVFDEFRRQAIRIRDSGRLHYSAWTILSWIRYEFDLRTVGDPFKINNDYIALYARLLIVMDSSFADFFTLRAMVKRGRRMSEEERERRGSP